jgi:uncharacterized protein YjbI with pentapeptide repeats
MRIYKRRHILWHYHTLNDLSYRELNNADLSGIDLDGANLRGANLSNANLRGADLSNANLRGADLSNANLFSAKEWTNEQLAKAESLVWATMPDITVMTEEGWEEFKKQYRVGG